MYKRQVQRLCEGLESWTHTHSLLSIEQANSLVYSNPTAALVVEIPDGFASDPDPTVLQVARLCNNPQRCPLFLLGGADAEPWSDIFREAGVAELCTSVLSFENFGLRLVRHLENHVRSELTVEQTVVARLPW